MVWATSHFRSYLSGNSFKLVTDHEPLKWIMTMQKLSGKLARWSLLLQEYDFTVKHRAGTDNTNVDCLSRYPLQSSAHAPILDWTRGEILAPASFLALMVGNTPPNPDAAEEKNIWHDVEVLHFLKTHNYERGMSARNKDRVYHRAKAYRWMADIVLKVLIGGTMVVVPRPEDRASITLETHRGMGHFGVQRVLVRL